MNDLAGAIRRAGFRGTINVGGNGDGSAGSDEQEVSCTDPAHLCQAVDINNDSTDWRECNTLVDWADARAMCNSLGAGWDLAFFTSIAEEQSVGAIEYDPSAWIGYYQGSASAPYTWTQNSSTTFAPQSSSDPTNGAFWDLTQPNGANPGCVEIVSIDELDPLDVVAYNLDCGGNFLHPLCRYLP
jgi:hypothetical protein